MKKNLMITVALLTLPLSQMSLADSGLFFNVTGGISSLNIYTSIPNHTYPTAGIKITSPGVSITSGCAPSTNGYCLFSVSDKTAATINLSHSAGNINAVLCLDGSGPLSCQNYTIPTGNRFAYWGAYANTPTINFCSINQTTGALTNCSTTGSGFSEASGVAINSAGTRAYVSNYSSNSVSVCNVNTTTGALSGCTSTGSNFSEPTSIAINPAGTMVYVTDYQAGAVTMCNINQSTGALIGCIESGAITSEPQGLAFNNAGTFLYIGGYVDLNVCNVNPSTGGLSNCVTTGNNLSDPAGIALNPTNTKAYVTNYGNETIAICDVNANTGLLSGCTTFHYGTTEPDSIAINSAGTYAYITSYSSNGYVGQCSIDTNTGLITGCALMSAPEYSTGITLH